jgi:hypothetical protein
MPHVTEEIVDEFVTDFVAALAKTRTAALP